MLIVNILSPYIKLHIIQKKTSPIQLKGKSICIDINPNDTLSWKLSMLLEASIQKGSSSIEQIAAKYGYTREYFYQVLDKYKEHGSEGLRNNPPRAKEKL